MSELNKKSPSLHTKGLSKKDINSLLVQKALTELKRKDGDKKEEETIVEEVTENEKEPEGVVLSVKQEDVIKNSIQIVSDIHLECDSVYELMPKIKPKAPIIALLGNIGYPQDKEYLQFIEELSKHFQHVLVLAGNQEYYTSEYHHVDELIAKVCSKFKNVHFLQCNTIEFPDVLPNVKIAGCTLWMTFEEKIRAQAAEQIEDYSMIEIQKSKEEMAHQPTEGPDAELPKADKERRNLTIEDTERIHKEHATWLVNEIEQLQSENTKCQEDKQKQLVILTHHPPTGYPSAESLENPSPSINCNHLEHLFQYPVGAWFFGHSHRNVEYIVQSTFSETKQQREWNTVIASNQQGHLHPKICSNYQTDKVFVFPLQTSKSSCEIISYEKINTFSFMKRVENLKV